MLEYAASAIACWPAALIRSRFEARENDPAAELAAFLQGDAGETPQTADQFWQTVDTNLRAGRVRLVFVADVIPPELRRIVEFLNTQMNPAEVLAIEVKQYIAPGFRTLVPAVIGQTARAAVKGTTRVAGNTKWDHASFVAELRARKGQADADVAEKILAWAQVHLPAIWWGEGAQMGSFFVGIQTQSDRCYPFAVWTNGRVEMQFQALMRRPEFAEEEMRRELARRLNEIPGIGIPRDGLKRRPAFDLAVLSDPEQLEKFFAAMRWFISQLQPAAIPATGAS
jgi:hypothetical protein